MLTAEFGQNGPEMQMQIRALRAAALQASALPHESAAVRSMGMRSRQAFDLMAMDVGYNSGSDERSGLKILRDASLIVGGWGLFIGVVLHPEAQLVGLTVCAIAFFLTGGRKPA